MSPIVLLSLVAFWYWAWGLTGMILGVPLAVIMKILLESDERTLPIAIMLSRNPPLSVDDNDQVSSVETLSSDDSETLCNPLVESEKNSSSIDHLPPFSVTDSQGSRAKTEKSFPGSISIKNQHNQEQLCNSQFDLSEASL